MLPLALVMTVILSGAGMPDWRMPIGNSEIKSRLQHAVLRFDTRIVFSCEEFVRDMVNPPSLVNMHLRAEGLWERIKNDARARRSSAHASPASPECLVQAGLLVV